MCMFDTSWFLCFTGGCIVYVWYKLVPVFHWRVHCVCLIQAGSCVSVEGVLCLFDTSWFLCFSGGCIVYVWYKLVPVFHWRVYCVCLIQAGSRVSLEGVLCMFDTSWFLCFSGGCIVYVWYKLVPVFHWRVYCVCLIQAGSCVSVEAALCVFDTSWFPCFSGGCIVHVWYKLVSCVSVEGALCMFDTSWFPCFSGGCIVLFLGGELLHQSLSNEDNSNVLSRVGNSLGKLDGFVNDTVAVSWGKSSAQIISIVMLLFWLDFNKFLIRMYLSKKNKLFNIWLYLFSFWIFESRSSFYACIYLSSYLDISKF